MKKLSRNGLWDHVRTFILSGLVRGTLAGEIFYRGWSRGPGSSISAARAGPVSISDVLWHGPVPWSFNPGHFLDSGPTSSACVARVVAHSKSGCACAVVVACHFSFWQSPKERRHAVSLNRDQLRPSVHIDPNFLALYMVLFI